ncbi:MAG: hypothetical protein WBP35_03070 [Lactococcus chungangensis]
MHLTIVSLDDGRLSEINIDNFTELSYYISGSTRIFHDNLSSLQIFKDVTYNFKGDKQVSLIGSKISYIELSNS